MGDTISAQEWQLLSFFEVEPTSPDGEAWPYSDFLYQVSHGDLHLSCAVAPAYKDVRIILRRGERVTYELNAMGIEDVRYHDEGGEALAFVISARDTLWLRLKPEIALRHDVNLGKASP
jgi:hypothetical protein